LEREKEKDVGEDMKLGLPERKYYGSYIRAGEEYEREGITTYHFMNKDEDELFRYFEIAGMEIIFLKEGYLQLICGSLMVMNS